jgi:hypothetical protein
MSQRLGIWKELRQNHIEPNRGLAFIAKQSQLKLETLSHGRDSDRLNSLFPTSSAFPQTGHLSVYGTTGGFMAREKKTKAKYVRLKYHGQNRRRMVSLRICQAPAWIAIALRSL